MNKSQHFDKCDGELEGATYNDLGTRVVISFHILSFIGFFSVFYISSWIWVIAYVGLNHLVRTLLKRKVRVMSRCRKCGDLVVFAI